MPIVNTSASQLDRLIMSLQNRLHYRQNSNGAETLLLDLCAVFSSGSANAFLISSARTVSFVTIIAAALWNRAIGKQTGKITSMDCISQEERIGHVEDFLHGA